MSHSLEPPEIADLTTEQLRREPVIYNVEFIHTHKDFSVVVRDVSGSPRARLAVARDMEHAARMLRKEHEDAESEAQS